MTETTHVHTRGSDGVVRLPDLAARLLEEAHAHNSQRAAETITSGPSMRATVIALVAGAELAEHESPPAATLQVLVGETRLSAAGGVWLARDGEIVAIPPERHALRAITDAVVLLTVALH
ncbi:LuxR family transcriptional regulator [Knoellia sp. CPCC 206453]|uniref:LuxR family transcriptional regulator n=1 Tax=Knoellia pratensis TaxID=3404796 RepID=UPI00360AD7AA